MQQHQQENRENIKVIIRIRPKIEREKEQQCTSLVVEGNSLIAVNKTEQKQFTYDFIASETSTQVELFNECARPICDYTLEGYNGTIFAYGQTGSGKTFTLLGPKFSGNNWTPQQINQSLGLSASLDDQDSPSSSMIDDESIGVLPRVLMYLFDKIKDNSHINFSCSFLEIYKEQLNDLLDIHANKEIAIREIKNSIIIDGLSKLKISSTEEALSIVMKGTKLRRIAPTGMNKESSRSHAIFSIYIENRCAEGNEKKTKTKRSVFHIIDLAGSERQKSSETSGERLIEGKLINKSLMQLGFVIKNLTDSSIQSKHVHYRDSKLTHLLKDSLGGNAKTCLIANISPANLNIKETISTLMFAQRAKMIKNKAIINEEISNESLFRDEIRKLKDKYDSIKAQNAYLLSLLEKNKHSSSNTISSNSQITSNAFTKTLDSVEDEIESMVHDICSKEDEVKALTKENDYLKDKIQKYELDMKIIEKELKDYKDISKSLTKDNQTYEKQIKEYIMSNAYISQRVSQLESLLATKESMLKGEIETMRVSLEENQRMFSVKEETIAGLNKDINNYMTLINQKEQKISELISLNNQMQITANEAGLVSDEYQEDITRLNETIRKINGVIVEKEKVIKDNDEKIEKIKEKGKKLIEQYNENIEKLTNENRKLNEVIKERNSKHINSMKLIKDAKIRKDLIESKLFIANNQIRNDFNKVTQLQNELNEIKEKNAKLKGENSKLSDELEAFNQFKGQLTKAQKYSKLKLENDRLRSDIDNCLKSLKIGKLANVSAEALPSLLVTRDAELNEARRVIHSAIEVIRDFFNDNPSIEGGNSLAVEGRPFEEKFTHHLKELINYCKKMLKEEKMNQEEMELKEQKIEELNREISILSNSLIEGSEGSKRAVNTMTTYKKAPSSHVMEHLLQSDLYLTVAKKKHGEHKLAHKDDYDSNENKENTPKMNKPFSIDYDIMKVSSSNNTLK